MRIEELTPLDLAMQRAQAQIPPFREHTAKPQSTATRAAWFLATEVPEHRRSPQQLPLVKPSKSLDAFHRA